MISRTVIKSALPSTISSTRHLSGFMIKSSDSGNLPKNTSSPTASADTSISVPVSEHSLQVISGRESRLTAISVISLPITRGFSASSTVRPLPPLESRMPNSFPLTTICPRSFANPQQPRNASSAIAVSFGNLMLFNFLQLSNALSPMVLTLSGTTNSSKEHLEKAPLPIAEILSDKSKVESETHPENI